MSATRLQQVLLAGEQARSKHVATGTRRWQMVKDLECRPITPRDPYRKDVQLRTVTTELGSDGFIGRFVLDIDEDYNRWDYQGVNRNRLLAQIQETLGDWLQDGMEVGAMLDAAWHQAGEMTGAFMKVVGDGDGARLEWSGDFAGDALMFKLWNAATEFGSFVFYVGPDVSGFRRLQYVERNGSQEGSRFVHEES